MEQLRVPPEMFRFTWTERAGLYVSILHGFAEANERLETALGIDEVRTRLRPVGWLEPLDDPDLPIGARGGTPMHFDDPGDWLCPTPAGDLWKPVIAAVNGMACGGAFYLLGEVEFIIAAEHATFFDPHTSYGMAAVFESMAMLRRMPLGEVMRMQLTGVPEPLSGQRAHQAGPVQGGGAGSSTCRDATPGEPKLLRQGGVSADAIHRALAAVA